jgi:hypothetical protein
LSLFLPSFFVPGFTWSAILFIFGLSNLFKLFCLFSVGRGVDLWTKITRHSLFRLNLWHLPDWIHLAASLLSLPLLTPFPTTRTELLVISFAKNKKPANLSLYLEPKTSSLDS